MEAFDNPKLQKTILWVLKQTQDYDMHDNDLAAEVKIAYGAPVTQQEFEAATKKLIGERWVEKTFDFWNEPVYHITENGLAVADRTKQ